MMCRYCNHPIAESRGPSARYCSPAHRRKAQRQRNIESGHLTVAELSVLSMHSAGLTKPEIAQELGISAHTVREHADNARAKLGASTIAHAVAICYQHGLFRTYLAA